MLYNMETLIDWLAPGYRELGFFWGKLSMALLDFYLIAVKPFHIRPDRESPPIPVNSCNLTKNNKRIIRKGGLL